jgi:WD40 repeat protein
MSRKAVCIACRGPLEADDAEGLCTACLHRSLLFEDPIDESGADLGDYEIQSEIARGGMGVVFRARSRRLKRIVALKLVHLNPAAGEAMRRRFLFEAETAAALDHPNIVPVYEFGESNGRPWFSMKLVEGPSLEARLDDFVVREGKPDPDRCRKAAALMATVARAVQYAHEHGVLHRDLKPSNILLDQHGTPHVTDFGLAKRIDGAGSHTLPEAVLGTPAYMAPEVARSGAASAGVLSDVYSLGAVLHHLLAGHPPYSAHSPLETIRQVVESKSPSASRLGPQVDRDLAIVCAKCLEHSDVRRYPSAGALADELDRYLRNEPIQARAITAPELAWHWCRRRPVIAALGAFLVVALAAGSSGILWQWRRAEISATAARAAERTSAENAYFAIVAQARSARELGDLGGAVRLLDGLDPARRGFEWRLLKWLCRGDALRSVDLQDASPRCITWVPKRHKFAIIGDDRRLRWFDPATDSVETGPVIEDRFSRHSNSAIDRGFHAIVFAADGRHFFCADGDVLIVADADTGTVIHSGAGRHATGVWLDETHLLYGGNIHWGGAGRGDPTVVFDTATGTGRAVRDGCLGPFAISADRKRLAWVRFNGEIEINSLSDVLDGVESPSPGVLSLPNSAPAMIEFSADGENLAMCSGGSVGSVDRIEVQSIRSREAVFRQVMPVQIRSMTVSPVEPVIALATDDSVLRTIRFARPAAAAPTYDDATTSELAQPVGELGPTQPPARLLSRSAGEGRFQFLLGHRERLLGVAALPDALGWATVSADRTVRLWPAEASAPRSRLGGVFTLNMWEHPASSADGRHILHRTMEIGTRMWNRETGGTVEFPPTHYPVAILKDGRALTREASGEIVCWRPPEQSGGRPVPLWSVQGTKSHPGFGQTVRGVVSKDERVAVALIPGKLITLRLDKQIATGTDDQRMLYGVSGVNCLDLSPDGAWIAVTGFIGGRARLYGADNIKGPYVSLGDTADYDTAVAFHPDGRRLFVGNEDGWVRVFDVETRSELKSESWRAQTGAVTALAVSPDGRMLATSGDRTMKFWDALPSAGAGVPRRERLQMNVAASRNWMRFSEDGATFLHAAPSQPLEIWEAP